MNTADCERVNTKAKVNCERVNMKVKVNCELKMKVCVNCESTDDERSTGSRACDSRLEKVTIDLMMNENEKKTESKDKAKWTLIERDMFTGMLKNPN